MTSPTPPGWYPDPGATAPFRWWDGQTWTPHTSAGAPPPAPLATAGFAAPAIPQQPQPYGYQPMAAPSSYPRPQKTGWEANEYAFFTFGALAIYAFIALTTPFVFIGFTPLLLARYSARRYEPLAQVATIASIIGVVVGVFLYVHRFHNGV